MYIIKHEHILNLLFRQILLVCWHCWMKNAGSLKLLTRHLWRNWSKSKELIPSSKSQDS